MNFVCRWIWMVVILAGCSGSKTITLLHFSDYHSHAVPFYSEGEAGTAGIARAVAFLKPLAARDDTLVFSGGDMINRGSPAWSDKFRCAEWPWLNGIVDAMAYGNHESDYGREEFARCAASVKYPILRGARPWTVLEANGVRVGVFAVAGRDFAQLVKGESFADPVETARKAVTALHQQEKADLVVMIGHQNAEDDAALAKAVPGIDIIFGTHSHLKADLKKIEGTETWTISPFQYLTWISKVEVTLEKGRVAKVNGELVRMDAAKPQDPEIASRVAAMQKELQADSQYAQLFTRIGKTEKELSVDDLGWMTTEAMRAAASTDCGMSTNSSFRQPIPAGEVREEDLRAALPYKNLIYVYELAPPDFATLMEMRATHGAFASCAPAKPKTTYTVAVTDYMARTADGYREFFANRPVRQTEIDVRDVVRAELGR
jgi:5'-nucleotidase/UDP-sugar diphosphatase